MADGEKRNPYKEKTDDEMIADISVDSPNWLVGRQMEMVRRLKDSVERLDVTTARLNRWMIGLTVAILVLTLILVFLAFPDAIEAWRRLLDQPRSGVR